MRTCFLGMVIVSLLAVLGQGTALNPLPLYRTLGILEGVVLFDLSALSDGRILVQAIKPDLRAVALTVMLWDLTTGERREFAIPGPVGVSATSADGRLLAVNLRPAEEEGEIGLWNIETGELRHTLRAPQYLTWILFSPDGETIAAGSVDRTIRLWSISTGEEIRTLVLRVSTDFPAVFAPDGRTLAFSGPAYQVKLWDVTLGQEVHTFTGHTATVFSAAFSPDGRILATGSWDGTIRLWDVLTGGELGVIDVQTTVREEEYHPWFSPLREIFSSPRAWPIDGRKGRLEVHPSGKRSG